MHFGNPIALWALAFLPVLAYFGWRAARRRRRSYETLGERSLVTQLFHHSIPRWHVRRFWIALTAIGLLGVSAARPQYGRVEQTLRRAGIDVLIAIDTSPSMMASDVMPNRLQMAKSSLKRLVRGLRGNRLGIIAFDGDAFLLCPMTLDHALANLILDSVDGSMTGVAGTDFGRAIRVAQGAFKRGGTGSAALVLITDGEDNEGNGLEAAEEAAEAGIRIFALGIGTDRGAPVPDGRGGFKEREDGAKVVSQLDMAGLREIAEVTGGRAFDGGSNPSFAVNSIISRIDRMQKGELESRKIVLYQDRYPWFIAPAMVLLLWLLVSRPRRHERAAPVVVEDGHGSHAR